MKRLKLSRWYDAIEAESYLLLVGAISASSISEKPLATGLIAILLLLFYVRLEPEGKKTFGERDKLMERLNTTSLTAEEIEILRQLIDTPPPRKTKAFFICMMTATGLFAYNLLCSIIIILKWLTSR